jgi:protein O-GlcNAc transferase
VTERLRQSADLWRDLVLADDATIAEQIRQDRIDVLVILGAHTGDNRPRVAAFRPSPVIVSAHDIGTSGMPEIGYWLTDATLHPPDTPEPFVERLVRLPSFYLQTPPADAPAIVPRPAARDHALFVSANNPAKLSPETIALWGRVLAAVPNARLMLKFIDAFADPATQRRHEAQFARHGVASDRIIFVSGSRDSGAHLAEIGTADIALDPFPFNGSTTTFEALWMGLPVVTLAGSCFVGRVGASLLAAAGLTELIAPDPEAYVRIAAGLATDSARLALLRAGLRERIAGSPLCRPDDYARSVERAYRQMWRDWCRATV